MADDGRRRTVDEHLAIVLDGIGSIDPIELTLLDAQGLLLAENVSARFPLPSFDNSSMDGYAVRAIDTRDASEQDPTTLQVVGDIAAGAKSRSGMGPGLAMRIMTGAPMPAGADAVIPLEDTDRGLARVALRRSVRTGECVRRAGEDIEADAPALGAGAALGPQQLALLAALGRDRVLVRPRPRVTVLSTGSELIEVGRTPGVRRGHRLQLLHAGRGGRGTPAPTPAASASSPTTTRCCSTPSRASCCAPTCSSPPAASAWAPTTWSRRR